MKTVLIMEDQLELASYWREFLEEAGYRVVHAPQMQDATSFLYVDEIDVIVTDMLIRDEDKELQASGGLTLLSHINLHVENKPKIIAVSGAHPDLHVLKHAASMGADHCICKPFTSDELLSVISDLLKEETPE